MILYSICLFAITSVTPFDGITLYGALNGNDSDRTILINNDGDILNEWIGADRVASTAYLLPGGELLRPCKAGSQNGPAIGGRIQKFSYDGEVLWDFTWGDENNQPHHDMCPMPNGNVLVVAWDKKTQAEGIAAGRQNLNTAIWPTQIVEIMPTGPSSGEVVWEWHLWDHIIQDISPSIPNYGVISEHPEKIDINKGNIMGGGGGGGGSAGDWIYVNALDYHPELDQIVFSSNSLDEIFIIDHSITTEEAAGPAGDFLYRWGNPSNYERKGEHVLWNVHGVNWIDEGLPGENNLLLFNNGNDDNSSDLIEFIPPLLEDGTYEIAENQPFAPLPGNYVFFYESNDFHGDHLCGVYRLPNGNTVATNGPGQEVREVNTEGEIVWQHFTPSTIMRAVKYSYDILDPPVENCPGDANEDGAINVSDILMAISDWGSSDSPADVNEDGIVNVSDVLLMINTWGVCP